MPHRTLKNHVPLWILITGMFSYIGIYALAGYHVTVEITSSLVLGTSAVLACLWLRTAVKALLKGSPGEIGEDLFNLGLFVLFFSVFVQRLWSNLLRWLERPDWLSESFMGPLVAWTIFYGLITILLSADTDHYDIPPRSVIYVILACVIGFTLAGINIGYFIPELK